MGRHPGNKGFVWSPEEIETLRREVRNGMKVQDIAAAHNRTIYGIVNKMLTLRIMVQRGHEFFLVQGEPWDTLANIKKLASGK